MGQEDSGGVDFISRGYIRYLKSVNFIFTGSDTVQRLWEDISGAVPCSSSEVCALQVI